MLASLLPILAHFRKIFLVLTYFVYLEQRFILYLDKKIANNLKFFDQQVKLLFTYHLGQKWGEKMEKYISLTFKEGPEYNIMIRL